MFPNAHENYKLPYSRNLELDIFIEDINLGIEYDGGFYHREYQKDMRKYKICKEYGISLIRIREKNCPIINDIATTCYYLEENNDKDLNNSINFIINYIKDNYNIQNMPIVNIESDIGKIYNLMDFIEEENSVAKKYPEISKEWHPTKNGKLKPEFMSVGSNKKVWWKCQNGHEWQASAYSRTKRKANCPICSNHKILIGYNDLATTHPELVIEWHPTKNGNLKPTDITSGSGKRVWWKCTKGHEWEISPCQRTYYKTGCPYCSNQKILTGYNNLATTHPEIAKEWHPTKNGDLKPDQLSIGSHLLVWWKCSKCGYEYKEEVRKKIRKQYVCNNCGKGI